eukprot:8027926-Pyramimonas_sp.AAC.1
MPPSIPEFPTLRSSDAVRQTALPTGARTKQEVKQRADIEAGIQPRKIPKVVEEGDDDYSDDLKGIGCSAYCTDVPLDSDCESNGV